MQLQQQDREQRGLVTHAHTHTSSLYKQSPHIAKQHMGCVSTTSSWCSTGKHMGSNSCWCAVLLLATLGGRGDSNCLDNPEEGVFNHLHI